VFAACASWGARVLQLPTNGGKGAALRAGFRLLLDTCADGPVITADADGQHAVHDILRVLDAVDDSPHRTGHLVLGERELAGDVPWRSRFGNTVTSAMFRTVTGRRLRDTQTGLRAFSSILLPWLLDVPGDRYEYELQVLLRAAREDFQISGVPIRTIYLNDNRSSHFRPVVDSARIYLPLLAFFASSVAGFAIDTVTLFALDALLGSLVLAVVGARVLSGVANFALNKRFAFRTYKHDRRPPNAAARYAALATGLLVANYFVLSTLVRCGLGLMPSKLVTEFILVVISYVAQARFVFTMAAFTGSAHDDASSSMGHETTI
jgi:putative flippase GtrA